MARPRSATSSSTVPTWAAGAGARPASSSRQTVTMGTVTMNLTPFHAKHAAAGCEG